MTLADALGDLVVERDIAAAIDALPTRVSDLGFDPWGFSPKDAKILYSLGLRIYRYFRPIVKGAENVPAGRALVAALYLQAIGFPRYLVNFYKYPCVIDDDAIRRAFEWAPRVSMTDTSRSTRSTNGVTTT